jgi:hypothetical protein
MLILSHFHLPEDVLIKGGFNPNPRWLRHWLSEPVFPVGCKNARKNWNNSAQILEMLRAKMWIVCCTQSVKASSWCLSTKM